MTVFNTICLLCKVICDGEPLTLPDDIEGVLFLNIHSYMGGVDLWASGVNSTGSARTAKQSLCDGKLEVMSSWALLVLVACAIVSVASAIVSDR